MCEKDIVKILDEYLSNNLPVSTKELIQGWLLSEEKSEMVDMVLYKLFYHTPAVVENSKELYQRLDEMHKRLGFPESIPNNPLKLLYRKFVWRAVAVLIPAIFMMGMYYFVFNTKPLDSASDDLTTGITVSVTDGHPNYLTLPYSSIVWINQNLKLVYNDDSVLNIQAYNQIINKRIHNNNNNTTLCTD